MKMDYYLIVSFLGILLVCLSMEAKASHEDSPDLLVRRERHDSYHDYSYDGGDQYDSPYGSYDYSSHGRGHGSHDHGEERRPSNEEGSPGGRRPGGRRPGDRRPGDREGRPGGEEGEPSDRRPDGREDRPGGEEGDPSGRRPSDREGRHGGEEGNPRDKPLFPGNIDPDREFEEQPSDPEFSSSRNFRRKSSNENSARFQKRDASLPGPQKLFYFLSQKQLFTAKFYFANDESDCENGPTESTQVLVNPYVLGCQFLENEEASPSLCLSQSIFGADNKTLTKFFSTAIGQINPGIKMFINEVTEPQTTEKFMFVQGDCRARWLPLPKAPSKSKRDVKELSSKVWSGGFTRSGGFKMLLFKIARRVLARLPYYIANGPSDCEAGPGENEIFIDPNETPCEQLNAGDALNLCIRSLRDFEPNSFLTVKNSFLLGGEPQGLKELLEEITNMPPSDDKYSFFFGRCVHGWLPDVESI